MENPISASQVTGSKKKEKFAWENLTTNEKVVFLGAIGMFLSYFLPWFSTPMGYSVGAGRSGIVMPLAAAIFSCYKLYRSKGATIAKRIRAAKWQIGIGIWGAATSFLGLFLVINNSELTPAIGAYLCTAGTTAVLIGGLKLKKELQQ